MRLTKAVGFALFTMALLGCGEQPYDRADAAQQDSSPSDSDAAQQDSSPSDSVGPADAALSIEDATQPAEDVAAGGDVSRSDVAPDTVLTGPCAPSTGALAIDESYTVTTDGFTGDEHTAQPKVDANDGRNGDNPRYRRHNVARAHGDYWYTSSYQVAPGEPDPGAPQWTDYVPDFPSLGIGCYEIIARYRATSNRASYPAQYRLMKTAVGDVLYERVQKSLDGRYIDENFGEHQLCADSFVRIQDPGTRSITFNPMRFIYRGPTCQ